jgi:regulator of replication initiation timing
MKPCEQILIIFKNDSDAKLANDQDRILFSAHFGFACKINVRQNGFRADGFVIWCLTAARERAKTSLTMTLKRWVLWLCIVALLAGEFFLFSANRQKDAALVSLREARQQVAQLQTELDQLKSNSAAAQGADNSRLRTDNQNLAQKLSQSQKEAEQLRAANQKLAQQLNSTLTDAQQQLQQLAAENQQVRAAAEQLGLQSISERNACINHLRQIDAAKQTWALENNKTADAIPTAQDLLPYFKDGTFPVCPGGGTYSINAVSELPMCSIPGHVLPP